MDALRTSYEDANARGGEANERLQRQLREAEDANVMSAALIERLRAELAEARGQWICSAGHRHGPHDVCNNPFPPAPPPAESTPARVPDLGAIEWPEGCAQEGCGHSIDAHASCGRCQADDCECDMGYIAPAESTPVQRIVMKETSWGGRYAVYAVTQSADAEPSRDDRCGGKARDGGPCTFTRQGHAGNVPHVFVEQARCKRCDLPEQAITHGDSAGPLNRHAFEPQPPAESTPVLSREAMEYWSELRQFTAEQFPEIAESTRVQAAGAHETNYGREAQLPSPNTDGRIGTEARDTSDAEGKAKVAGENPAAPSIHVHGTAAHPAPPDGIRERLERLEKRMDEYAAALEAKGEPGTHAVGRPGWRTPHRFVPGMWPHANECREETRSPNNESCGLPSSDSIHKGAKP